MDKEQIKPESIWRKDCYWSTEDGYYNDYECRLDCDRAACNGCTDYISLKDVDQMVLQRSVLQI